MTQVGMVVKQQKLHSVQRKPQNSRGLSPAQSRAVWQGSRVAERIGEATWPGMGWAFRTSRSVNPAIG